MKAKVYENERDGQIDFFDSYRIPYDEDNSILVDNTDGVYNGCLLEFKLQINNINKVLFQAVKYCSKMRIKGESVPATILLIDLNQTTVYVFHSEDYRDAIQTAYTGAASKDNAGFMACNPAQQYDYSDMESSNEVRKILKGKKAVSDMYMPVDIDENCIVGWAERYYREVPTASKGDFLGDQTGVSVQVTGEIREPRHFTGLIRPYTGKTNEKFKYLMDCLNDRLSKKDLGAFYTPEPYARKAAELVEMAVARVPEGNDYIILDRCAGTGNLEAALIGLYDKNGDELISHCVVSTYEYYEYKVLQERIGDLVRDIIPPTEANVVYENGKVANADAMSEEYINNPIIKGYVDDSKCTIILFENPPYQNSTSVEKIKTNRKNLWMSEQFKSQGLSTCRTKNTSANELSTLFIWSAFKYYLRQDTDSYVVFGPIYYWKTIGLVNKEFLKGFAFNRLHFHATDSTISCILWSNVNANITSLKLNAYDIIENACEYVRAIDERVSYHPPSPYNDKRKPVGVNDGTVCDSNGTECYEKAKGKNLFSIFSNEWIAYIVTKSFNFGPQQMFLHRVPYFTELTTAHGYYLYKDNYLSKLPVWVSKYFPRDHWYDKDVYCTTSDGGDAYTHDPDFLKSCLIYTCLSNQNKCLTFDGSDGRYYQNELCFDAGTLASSDLQKFSLNEDESTLMALWGKILSQAKNIAKDKGYDQGDTLGVYQITKELNTFYYEGKGKQKRKVYDYPDLNGNLDTLRIKLKEYYKKYITPKMFKYELIK